MDKLTGWEQRKAVALQEATKIVAAKIKAGHYLPEDMSSVASDVETLSRAFFDLIR